MISDTYEYAVMQIDGIFLVHQFRPLFSSSVYVPSEVAYAAA